VTTSILGYPSFLAYFSLNASTIGAFGSSYYGGNFVGTISNWWIPDKYGRKFAIQLSCVLSLLGCSLQAGAQNYATLLVGRIVGGVASGIIYSVTPSFASEISHPSIRGRIGGMFGVNVNFAYAFTEWL
jgi:MFS family permease